LDFAEFFTDHARRIAPHAWQRGLLFLFDYRGPFISVQTDEHRLRMALERITQSALDLLDDGFIFLTAQAGWNDSGLADIAISIAGTGQRAPDDKLLQTLQRLQLMDTRDDPAPDGARVATGACPLTSAAITFVANRKDGVLLAFDVTLPAWLQDVEPVPNARGARAWLISDVEGAYQALARRLQRMGWATWTFLSTQEALEQLQRMRPEMARPSLVLATESGQISTQGLEPLRAALPPGTRFAIATWDTEPPGQAAPADGFERLAWPLGPAELVALTRRIHEAEAPSSGETMPAPLSFRDRPQALVVDDNAVNLMVAGGLLQIAGFEAMQATHGEEAIAACRRIPPQLVLMDVHMPGMDGLQTTRVLRQMQREGSLPHFVIVAATADAVGIGEPACRDAGMDGYLSKPLSLGAIEAELSRLLPNLRRAPPAR